MTEEKINFKVVRDFGEIFNVSVKFLRQNFKLYFLSMLLLAGPFVLLNSFASAYNQSVMLDKATMVRAGRLYNASVYGWEYFLTLFTQFIALLAIMCSNYAFMIVYSENGIGNFTVRDVAKKINDHFIKISIGFIVFFVLVTIFAVSIITIITMFGSASPVAGVFFAFLFIIAMMLLGPNLLWQLSAAFLVILSENEIAFSAFGRTREVMRDNYWWTWLIVVCGTLMIFVFSLFFSLPILALSWLKMLSNYSIEEDKTSLIYSSLTIFCSFCATMVYSVLYIICGFHFFSLAEKQDGKGLMERINEIGKSTA